MKKSSRYSAALPMLAVLTGGVVIVVLLILSGPTTEPVEKTPAPRIVQTISVQPTNRSIYVRADGSVVPAREVVIRPQVQGRILSHHPQMQQGGFVEEGEELVRIDPADYQLALTEQLTKLEQAEFELEVEKGRQVVASREWQLLQGSLTNSEVNRSLVLREPHLRRTEAMIRQASNEIARAKLDLSRTSVNAPFNAKVLSESIEVGQLVDRGLEICTLVGTDEFWVKALLSLEDLSHIQLPGPDREGARARIFLDTGKKDISWEGQVVRLLSDLQPTSLNARLLIRVSDPFGLDNERSGLPLLLGSFVRIEIEAGKLENVLPIPRVALREGDRIWVVDENDELQIRDAEVLWKETETLLIANCMKPGEMLVLSDLRSALPGMNVNPQLLQ